LPSAEELLPACRRAEINHLIEPQGHVQEYGDVESKKDQWYVLVLTSTLLIPFGFLTLGVIHDLYYKDGHWIPHLIPNRVPM